MPYTSHATIAAEDWQRAYCHFLYGSSQPDHCVSALSTERKKKNIIAMPPGLRPLRPRARIRNSPAIRGRPGKKKLPSRRCANPGQ